MALIEESFSKPDGVIDKLKKMKFKDPATSEKQLKDELDAQAEEIENAFRSLLLGS